MQVRIVSPNATTLFNSNSNNMSHEGMLLTLCDRMKCSSQRRENLLGKHLWFYNHSITTTCTECTHPHN